VPALSELDVRRRIVGAKRVEQAFGPAKILVFGITQGSARRAND
jgi:hypothetical protein